MRISFKANRLAKSKAVLWIDRRVLTHMPCILLWFEASNVCRCESGCETILLVQNCQLSHVETHLESVRASWLQHEVWPSGAVQSCKVLFSPALESANDAVTVSWRCNSAWTYSMTFKENKSPGPSGTFSMRSLGGGSFQAGLRIQLQTIWPVECIYTRLICVHIYISNLLWYQFRGGLLPLSSDIVDVCTYK